MGRRRVDRKRGPGKPALIRAPGARDVAWTRHRCKLSLVGWGDSRRFPDGMPFGFKTVARCAGRRIPAQPFSWLRRIWRRASFYPSVGALPPLVCRLPSAEHLPPAARRPPPLTVCPARQTLAAPTDRLPPSPADACRPPPTATILRPSPRPTACSPPTARGPRTTACRRWLPARLHRPLGAISRRLLAALRRLLAAASAHAAPVPPACRALRLLLALAGSCKRRPWRLLLPHIAGPRMLGAPLPPVARGRRRPPRAVPLSGGLGACAGPGAP